MPDHIEPNLDAYLAGGLSPDERRDLEQHCAACPACAQQLTEGKQVDQLMDNLFAQTRPDAGLEDRTLERLRRKPAAKRYGILYFVYSAAAVIALGLIGAAAQAMIDANRLGKLRTAQVVADERVAQVDPVNWTDDSESMKKASNGLPTWNLYPRKSESSKMSVMNSDSSSDFDIKRLNGRLAKVDETAEGLEFKERPGAGLNGLVSGLNSAGTLTPDLSVATKNSSYGVVDGEKKAPPVNSPAAGFDGQGNFGGWANGKVPFGGGAPQDHTSVYGQGKASPYLGLLRGGEPAANYYLGVLPEPSPAFKLPIVGAGAPPDPTVVPPPPAALGYHSPSSEKEGIDKYFGFAKPDQTKTTPQFGGYLPGNKSVKESGYDQKKAEEKIATIKKDAAEKFDPATTKEEAQPALDTGRKIIRTGEMEFEIDSFYASVDTINGLLKKVTKGTGFVATSNSDKLPNGKMKGSVVVRMPPQHLDDFLAELRAALGKVGELKSQRIGSADVTKQYTDIESELRAARAVETRLIEIIKTGKGEIKDLVAAERELGAWRTKIEKMEGEIRYYNNQVSLSTVTITLSEKEIQAAVALVLRERVLMNIEVEEVEKAQDAIAAGVKAAKGRILKNDLNVGDAGQISAIVQVEVPPASAPLFRELLKKLGVVSKYQADRTQQAVGGSAEKALDLIKQRTDDVRFELNLYNSANIKPRETLHFKLGVADVTETYRTIRAAVAKMKGQIRKSDLNEKDPMNITAELVFNVAASDRAAIDKLIAAAGLIVSKHTVQAAINETATERTVGYELALRNIAAVPPRDIFTVAVASQDVAGSYRKLHDAVVQMKGRIHKGQLNEVDRFNVSAEFDFDVSSADKPALDKLISEAGVTIARKNEQFPAKDESTDQKVGYRLTLRNASGMTPREKAMLAIRVNDVDARAQQLKDLVAASKGRVLFSKSERSKNGETKMVLIFELPHAALDTIVRQIKEGQTPLVYDKELNPQVPDNSLATAQIALTLIAVPEILPSEGDGLGAMLHTGLAKAMYVFLFCLVVVISGLAFIVPWALPIWGVVWLVRRRNAAKTTAVEKPSEQKPA